VGLNIPLVKALTKVQSITQPQTINGGWVNQYPHYVVYIQLQDAGNSRITGVLTVVLCQEVITFNQGMFLEPAIKSDHALDTLY
jgi:hypothetical protein